jgi:hypothetical protein
MNKIIRLSFLLTPSLIFFPLLTSCNKQKNIENEFKSKQEIDAYLTSHTHVLPAQAPLEPEDEKNNYFKENLTMQNYINARLSYFNDITFNGGNIIYVPDVATSIHLSVGTDSFSILFKFSDSVIQSSGAEYFKKTYYFKDKLVESIENVTKNVQSKNPIYVTKKYSYSDAVLQEVIIEGGQTEGHT